MNIIEAVGRKRKSQEEELRKYEEDLTRKYDRKHSEELSAEKLGEAVSSTSKPKAFNTLGPRLVRWREENKLVKISLPLLVAIARKFTEKKWEEIQPFVEEIAKIESLINRIPPCSLSPHWTGLLPLLDFDLQIICCAGKLLVALNRDLR